MSKFNVGDSLILNSDIVVNGSEVKTGATFNGKSVYYKVIGKASTLTINTSSDQIELIAHNVSNLKYWVDCKVYYCAGSSLASTAYQLPFNNGTFTRNMHTAYVTGTDVGIQYYNISTASVYFLIHLWYTKTTD